MLLSTTSVIPNKWHDSLKQFNLPPRSVYSDAESSDT
jgi:hypothetical protein